MQNPYASSYVWFLTGSQDLYGPEVLDQVAQNSAEIVAALNASGDLAAEVVAQPTLKDRDAIRRTMLAANADENCLGVIVWMHTFSPAKMWIQGLNALDKPMLHLHTQANVGIPWESIDMDFMNLNQAAHGDREFAYMATRLGTKRAVVVGHVSDARVRREIDDWVRVAAGRAALRSMRLARFGDNMRNVAVTEGDKTEAEAVFGVSVNTWGVNELVEVVDAVSDAAVGALVAEYETLYDVVPELRRGGDRHESLRYGARLELGLRAFLEGGGFTAFTTNFEDLGGLRQLPGLAVQRLMADGYGFGAEGDWKTAVLVRAAKVMGFGRPGGASLMEDYTYHLDPGNELILGAHMLEVCPTLSSAKARLEIHPLGIGDREDPVRLVFTADPGPAVVVSLADMGDRFRLTANTVTNVDLPHDMPRLPVGRALWASEPDFATATTCWLLAGGAHHTCMSTNVSIDMWRALADATGVELAEIGPDTSVAGFRRELRASAAYHRFVTNF
ncbi:L-arabinose isomerase [Micrococcales bacterium 31B]|nr:L-arabinose isomerase [Micrococcales bacterium 31B]